MRYSFSVFLPFLLSGIIPHRFEWQTGYGSFSVSYSARKNVINYIKNQQKHHKIKSFADEYTEILKQFDIEINDKTNFEPLI